MPLLQVRDFPADLYEKLKDVAEAERRSVAQQTVVIVRDALAQPESDRARRQRLLAGIRQRARSLPKDLPTLVREEAAR